VKLDRSFVAGLSHDPDKASIISAVLWLATSLRMSVVAEGVEDVEDWIALERAQCPAVQGYLFSRPLVAEDLDRFLPSEEAVAAAAAAAAAEPASAAVPQPRESSDPEAIAAALGHGFEAGSD
jgi:predicted signal transduction protein with EAL and GGDEF domain